MLAGLNRKPISQNRLAIFIPGLILALPPYAYDGHA